MSPTSHLSARKFYEERWVEPRGYSDPPGPRIRKLIQEQVSPGARCLDVGCGDGHIMGLWLHEMGVRYTGVDISENAISHARALGLDASRIEDAALLPFAEGSFDMVVCTEVLEHLLQPQLAAGEALRVLRSGGVLIASTPNVTHWRHRFQFSVAGRWDPYGDQLSRDQPWRDPHIRFFTAPTLKHMLRMAGFTNVRILGEQPHRLRQLAKKIFGDPAHGFALPTCFSRRLLAIASKPAVSE